MNNNTNVVSKKINSAEELASYCARGVLVTCPKSMVFEKPRKAEALMAMSFRSVLDFLAKGVYAVGEEESAQEDSILHDGREAIRSLGLSQREIAEKVGVTQQAVQRFMNAESVTTKVLSKYLDRLGVKNAKL